MASLLKSYTDIALEKLQQKDFYGAALKLREIQEERLFLTGGFENFRAFVDEQLKTTHYRTVMNLIRMTKDQKRLKYTPAQVRRLIKVLGVSKTWIAMKNMKEAIPADEAISMFESNTNSEIESTLKSIHKGEEPKSAVAPNRWTAWQ